jgi:hypothetical protein
MKVLWLTIEGGQRILLCLAVGEKGKKKVTGNFLLSFQMPTMMYFPCHVPNPIKGVMNGCLWEA